MTLTVTPDETITDIACVEQTPPAIDAPHVAQTADTEPETSDSAEPADADAAADTDEPVGEFLRVDPRTLVIGANVRRDVVLDKPFLRSIADRGVREPIIARRDDQGVLVVRKGKRRALAAAETGRATVPVLVEPGRPGDDPAADDRREVIDRIVDQLEENQHCAGTSEVEPSRTAGGVQQIGGVAGGDHARVEDPETDGGRAGVEQTVRPRAVGVGPGRGRQVGDRLHVVPQRERLEARLIAT